MTILNLKNFLELELTEHLWTGIKKINLVSSEVQRDKRNILNQSSEAESILKKRNKIINIDFSMIRGVRSY